jgi:hypothetical protein
VRSCGSFLSRIIGQEIRGGGVFAVKIAGLAQVLNDGGFGGIGHVKACGFVAGRGLLFIDGKKRPISYAQDDDQERQSQNQFDHRKPMARTQLAIHPLFLLKCV